MENKVMGKEGQDIFIKERISESIKVKNAILVDPVIISTISSAIALCVDVFTRGNKILLCGNGGSAADAQHLAAEFTGRFYKDREPLFAEALHVNSSYLTAVANDYSYDEVYSRIVKGKGRKGDVLIGLSTSGNSINVIKAIKEAKNMGMKTIGFTGSKPSKLSDAANITIMVPSEDTPRIQEAHITIGHIICEAVENKLFS